MWSFVSEALNPMVYLLKQTHKKYIELLFQIFVVIHLFLSGLWLILAKCIIKSYLL